MFELELPVTPSFVAEPCALQFQLLFQKPNKVPPPSLPSPPRAPLCAVPAVW